MNVEQFLVRAFTALAASAAVSDFCQEHYGKPLTLACGVDPAVGVAEDDLPACSLSINDHQFSNVTKEVTVEMEAAVAVSDQGEIAVGGVLMRAGMVRSHRLRQLVLEALMAPGLGIVKAGGGVDELVIDPLFVSYSNITITTK
jgi:hypothetical protein